jgi:hypothetical protein
MPARRGRTLLTHEFYACVAKILPRPGGFSRRLFEAAKESPRRLVITNHGGEGGQKFIEVCGALHRLRDPAAEARIKQIDPQRLTLKSHQKSSPNLTMTQPVK